jgi:hypothetical protein
MVRNDFAKQRRRKLLERLVVEAEWRHCKRDKEYAYENYFYIPSAEAELGRAPFKLWDFQKQTQKELNDADRLIIAKTRQVGMTTQTMCDSFHNGFFNTGRYELLVVSKSQEDAKTNLSMLDHVWRFMPEWMKQRGPRRTDNSTEQVTFTHKDGALFRSVSIVGTPKRGAGKTANRVVLDEFALMDKPSQIYRALEPTTLAALNSEYRRGAVFVILSTPRGARNAFAKQWLGAKKGEVDRWTALYHPVTCNKFLAGFEAAGAAELVERIKATGAKPELELVGKAERFWTAWRGMQQDPAYRDEPWNFFSEYARNWEEAFRESGRARFQHLPGPEEVSELPYAGYLVTKEGKVEVDLAVATEDYDSAPWKFAYLPEDWPRDVEIVLAADPASGVLGDYSAAVVLGACRGPENEDAVEILAAFWSNAVSPAEFADELVRAGRYFKSHGRAAALCVVERPPGGGAGDGEVIGRMRQARYPMDCMFRYTAQDRVTTRRASVYGWPTDRATKPEAIRALGRLLTAKIGESGELEPYPLLVGLFPEARDQLVSFVILNQPDETGYEKLGADAGGHDDLVMALALGAAVMERHRKSPKARTTAPSGEGKQPLPSGVFTLWSPEKYLKKELDAAKRQSAEEAVEFQRELAEREQDKWLRTM